MATLLYFQKHPRVFYSDLKMVSDEIQLLPRREALCRCPCAWKLLRVHKSNERQKYNHMFMCHANNTPVKDDTEASLGRAVAVQIQLASRCQRWNRSTLTASTVYKYVLVEISLRVTPSAPPRGFPIAHIVTSLLLFCKYLHCRNFLAEQPTLKPPERGWLRPGESGEMRWGWVGGSKCLHLFAAKFLQFSCCMLLNC